ncbi:MAG: hypothetical protein ABJP45_03005 [Cyclobacteriaceae bacterium]
MKSQYIKLLKKQIAKLDDEHFDLEAWKSSAISVLSRVFGKDDLRAEQIEELKIDYSSWALRDSNANYKPVETAKLKGREILNTAVEEIEIFGAPENHSTDVLGKEFAKEIQSMSEPQRKKHFEGMKKEKLVELLMKLTS